MIVTLEFATGQSPTLRLYYRDARTSATSAIAGVESVALPTDYDFNIGSVPVGDYEGRIQGITPEGRVKIRITSSGYLRCLEWHELDPAVVSGNVTTTSPVSPTGIINGPIIIGDDYLAANSRAFLWEVDAVAGLSAGTATTTFGGDRNGTGWLVSGTVADLGASRWRLAFNLPRSATQALEPGYYAWSVEVKGPTDGAEVTRVRSGKQVELVEKAT